MQVLKPNNRSMAFNPERLRRYIERITSSYSNADPAKLFDSVMSKIGSRPEIQAEEITRLIYMSAVELITIEEPMWTYVAARAYLTKLYKEAALNRGYKSYTEHPYGSFLTLIKTLVDKGIYKEELLTEYTEDEIRYLEQHIVPDHDKVFDYIGIVTLAERYLASDYDGKTMELPQERFMVIAMQLMIKEDKDKRLGLILESYEALANQYMTVATPTLANAGKAKGGQLSSCFIDTVDDDLYSIYNDNTDVARLSKMGGGIGVYMGKVRSRGSKIRDYFGKSSGVVPWIRQLNNTAVSVDQLGTRKGSIAIYLDVWHKDILAFLDLKLNNGDERLRAHDIFPGVCIPDLFMEAVEARGEWHLFDPHEVRQVMGWSLEDFYDEEKGNGSFRNKYQECVDNPNLSRVTVQAIDIMKRIMKSQLETGTPYMFYRDTVNRANPNKHKGMIYSSNLCVEIAQNMSPTRVISEELVDENGDTVIVTKKKPGDFVVCNLASINLARALDKLDKVVPIAVRMLDNVIDLNNIEVLQAKHTNSKYRAIGLGTSGLHHAMALQGIMWESEAAYHFNDNAYKTIAYLAIKASMELAKEKGAYPLFKGSEWETGEYFRSRGYFDDELDADLWMQLAEDVAKYGIRNGYLMAIAPTGSTSIIAGTTASIDPIYKLMPYEEKTTYKIPHPAPDLNAKTIQYYRKNAFMLDQHASIRLAAVRQRHIDQAQSFNLYVRPDIKAREFLDLHLDAWKSGLKTTYYVRSQALTVEDCDSCSA